MAYTNLKQAIADYVKENHLQEITGEGLQEILFNMVDSLGADYQMAGVATPETNPGTPDQKVVYIAGPGTYPNFGPATIGYGKIGILSYNGSWSLSTITINDSLPAYININELANHPAAYADAATALADVPVLYRRKGVKVVYLDDVQQLWIEMICQDDAGVNWWTDVANNWTVEGPIQTDLLSPTGGLSLDIAGQRRGNLDDVLNVNVWNGQIAAYATQAAARAAVPANKRKLGAIITYLLAQGWVTEQFKGSNTSDWTDATKWEIYVKPLKHITGLVQCSISLTYNQDGTLTAVLSRDESQGFIYHENGYVSVNNTSFSDTFQLNQNGLNIIYYDVISSEIKYSRDINELDSNSIVIEIFYSNSGYPLYWCWSTPIITRTNLQPNGCGSYFSDLYLNSIRNRITHIENWQIPFARLTRLVNSTIVMNYANGVITAILTRVSNDADGLLYCENGYIGFTQTQTFTLNVIPNGLNVIYYNRANGISITNTTDNLTKNDIVLEIFYAYSNAPTFGCWTCPLITKNGFGTGVTENGLRYLNPSEIPVIDFKSYRRATNVFMGTMSMSYDSSTHKLTASTTGGFLYDNSSYVAISAFSAEFTLTPRKVTAICWNRAQGFVKYESGENYPIWSEITPLDIVLEIFYNYDYVLVAPALWTSPFIAKTGFPTDYENACNSFCNTKTIKDLNLKVLDLEKKRALPYTAKIFRRIGCIGDSYTKGYIYPSGGTVTEDENYAWPHYMEGLTNNKYTNFGVSGSTAKGWMSGAAKLAQVQAEGNKCQAYIVGLMINDRNNADWNLYYTPVGVIGDIGTDNDTYYAWYYKLIQAVIAVNPLAPIFCNTCPAYANNDAYNQAVRDIVEYCHNNGQKVYLNDLASDIYKTANFFLNPTFVADAVNGHYTAIGYEFMAECLKDILSDTINANQSEFQTVHLIPFDSVN